ncbi:MAG: ABC transporter ATP-binding protein [Anaerolineae bacterium]|nr:ABC transporter ATP-binding protein [Anaerolineae bacterium]
MWFPLRSGFFDRLAGYVKAVDNVSFRIFGGETVGLVGESGCGKTTVGRCIVRAYQPTGGQILYNEDEDLTDNLQKLRVHIRHFQPGDEDGSASQGHLIDLVQLTGRDLKPYRHEIRMIFQDPYSSLNPRMTVLELVGEVLQVNHLVPASELQDRVAELLQRVGLRPEYMQRYPHAFSGGERQRIVIARALATNPRLIVADEAISALDVSIRAQILNLLEELQDELGLTYLFIAHDLSVVRHICDRVNVMYVGKLVESAEATALYTYPKHPYTEALMSSVPIHDPKLRRRGRRIRLEGEVADPSHPPTGCYFHPRCQYAVELCGHEEPAPRSVTDDSGQEHYVACHLAEELTLRGAIADAAPQGA